ncbi:MAG: DUF6481 family protein [Allosphingosinicella sp.]
MKSYQEPSFQDRVGRAADAKNKALEQLRSKPAADESDLDGRRSARLAKEAEEKERREAKKAAELSAKAAKASERAKVKAETAVAAPTEADKKAARDARYAARKKRA